jgi:amidase
MRPVPVADGATIASYPRCCAAYAVADYPSVTVPAGLRDFIGPSGLTFTGGYLRDGEVLGYACAYEQASGLRVAPAVGEGTPRDE